MKEMETQQYESSHMTREVIMERLRQRGFRITNQRKILMDIILKEQCTSCKEIYYLAAKEIPGIGIATIYRMLNTLEEVGAINRTQMYQISAQEHKMAQEYLIELEDASVIRIDQEALNQMVEKTIGQKVRNMVICRIDNNVNV